MEQKQTHPERLFAHINLFLQEARRQLSSGSLSSVMDALRTELQTLRVSDLTKQKADAYLAAVFYTVVGRLLAREDVAGSYQRLVTTPEFNELCVHALEPFGLQLDPALRLEIPPTLANLNFQLWQFNHSGRRVYEVSPGLALQLANTEIRGLTTDDLRPPYQTIFIVVPPQAGLTIWNRETGFHAVEGIYLTETSVGERVWSVMWVGESKGDLYLKGDAADDALLFMNLSMPEGASMEEAIRFKRDEIKVHETAVTRSVIFAKNDWEALFRWLSNVVVYATWPEGERENVWLNKAAKSLWERMWKLPRGPKRTKLSQDLDELDRRKRVFLGGSISVSRVRAQLDEPSGHHKGTPLHLRIRVAGHWKRIAHGAKRAERRWQYIDCYWRGPEDAPTPASRDHVLGERQ